MHLSKTCLVALAAVSAMVPAFAAAAESPNDVLVESREVRLTRADYEAGLAQIPADLRDDFATSPRRLTMLISNILVAKTLAARARAAGLEPDASLPKETPADVERALAAAQTRKIQEDAGRDFDSRRESFVPVAREKYLLDKDRYRRPEEVRLSAILISTNGRGDDEALELARATRAKLVAWADFAALAKELSDDKGSAADGGRLPWASADKMDAPLAKEAFALTRIGEISEPVRVAAGYILIRLDERRPATTIPFDEVKDSILEALRTEYVAGQREAQLTAIRSDTALKVDQPALDALVRRVDPKLLQPGSSAPAPQASPAAR